MKHLKDSNTTYFKHLHFAWKTSSQMLILVVIGVIHGLIPWLFKDWVSSGINSLDDKMHGH